MNFVGVDLHKYSIVVCVVDASRKLLQRRRFSNTEMDAMRRFFSQLGPFRLVVEATASYEWFVQLVEPFAERVVLAHPGRLRIIAESTRKSDKLDSRVLAEMLALDQVPASYRPTPRQRDHRRLVRDRAYLQRRITAAKNRLRRILSDYNQDIPNLFTKVGLKHLKAVALSAADRFVVQLLLKELKLHLKHKQLMDARIREFRSDSPAREQEDRAIIQSPPGVGVVTTETFLAEVGDASRFSAAKKLVAYVGLAPGQRESDRTRHELHIEKTGSKLLRWVLVQAAWQLVRRSKGWNAVFQRLAARLKPKKAIVAIARRLVCLLHSLLTRRVMYEERYSVQPAA